MGNINVMGGGFDLRKYTPKIVLSNATLTSAYQTLLNITGEGFLNHALVSTNTGAGANSRSYMKITIDGAVLFEGTAKNIASVDSFTGFIDLSKIVTEMSSYIRIVHSSASNISMEYLVNLPTPRNLPYTGASDGIVYADSPLFFKTSLKIECKVEATSVACNTLITYGVKV